ncbi:Troponin I, fast skeletal muscle [Labeo rohita]|uniref:Troponin I, fast skeletal muscle n=1 Tax=Labeo rohita TaxID=84645 RepID=A0ABQ8LD13_LABRO|nr:Troponin I, fast skeletal muscle [Labeo rohita]
MLSIAKGILEQEVKDREVERQRYMAETCPPLSLPSGIQSLQELCRELHHKIDAIDEERYDMEMKVNKSAKEIEDLNIKVIDLKGKFKKPTLRKVRMSADAMLQALLGSKHKVSLDLRANLKQVKKEVKEEDKELRDVGDWRKNVEDKAGMDGRKKIDALEDGAVSAADVLALRSYCSNLLEKILSDEFGNHVVLLIGLRQQCKKTGSSIGKRMSSSKKHSLKSMMLQVAKELLEAEEIEKKEERKRYMEEHCPPLSCPSSKQELQELCKKLHAKVDVVDEERYILEQKAIMVVNEVKDLNIKIVDLKGKFKKPPLKKVRMSADAMLQALLGSKHKVSMDLRANLKQVKKEVKEEDKELRDVGDWRKNIEDKAGMGGRKKIMMSCMCLDGSLACESYSLPLLWVVSNTRLTPLNLTLDLKDLTHSFFAGSNREHGYRNFPD